MNRRFVRAIRANCSHVMKIRDSGTTTKYSKWHFPAEKALDFPPWVLLTFAGNPVICAVKRRFPDPGSGNIYRRILQWSFRVAVTLSFLVFWKVARKTTKKARIFYPCRTPEISGKEGKNAQKNKEFLAGGKNKEFQKNKERKDRVRFPLEKKVFSANRFARIAPVRVANRRAIQEVNHRSSF